MTKKILVAYYSHSGNTRTIADLIQKITNSDLLEIVPKQPYPENYNKCVEQAKHEINSGYKPELKNNVPNLETYDIVFVGSPNWWSTIAPPVTTFLSNCNLTGKTVIPFCTHGGGRWGHSVDDLKKLCPNADVLEGLAINGNTAERSKDDINKWLQKIRITKPQTSMKTLQIIIVLAGIFAVMLSGNLNAQEIKKMNEIKETKTIKETNSKKVTAGRDQLGSLAPKFAELNDDVLFGQVWSREEELPARDRSLVTIVSLIAGGNFEQLKFHLQKGKDNGLSKQEITEIITQQAFYSGWPKAWSAFNIVKEVYGETDTAKHTILKKSAIFPLGGPVNPQWFIGEARLKMISTENSLNTKVANVTFAPGARNHWHSHKVGQILLVTDGEGWYQEWGKPAQKLKKGSVVNISANVKHWHGATKDSWFVHLAINSGETEWFDPVTDKEYNALLEQLK
ncbi:MAG: carboxymuconolactone decarboxylase family protein [Planctomycetaceae bacterium]|jgi:alkylhydroperoxidase/carboxymuconolactone decarboxylase family protein YurZ/quercetin dioxygenase-like cupin family protein/flavodoxin|nr:carboxymuconolactone decarboxylase family protein [Planctomycetaceae bacterium]